MAMACHLAGGTIKIIRKLLWNVWSQVVDEFAPPSGPSKDYHEL